MQLAAIKHRISIKGKEDLMAAYCRHLKNPGTCHLCQRERAQKAVAPTLSIRPYENEVGTFSVDLHVHGLRTAAMAEKLADMLTAFMAGKEIQSN